MISKQEAIAIMKGGLGKAELELAASFTAPLFWIIREGPKKFLTRNASGFLLNAGAGVFGVTANHVVEQYRADCKTRDVVSVQLGHELRLDFDGKNSIIDTHSAIDIATFRVSDAEIHHSRKTVLTNYRADWPPPPPQQGRGIYYCGCPEEEVVWMSRSDISFGLVGGGGVASSVSDFDVSTQIDQEYLIDVIGRGKPPENYRFSGISGAPMLSVIEVGGLRLWALGGVIYQGPNPSDDESTAIPGLQIIRARRADFIKPDGTLDKAKWSALNPGR